MAKTNSNTNNNSESVPKDLGFGTGSSNMRNMNKDGSFNVVRVGEPSFRPWEIYHSLISMSWSKFLLLLFSAYAGVNLIFALIYYLLGAESLSMDASHMHEGEKFLESFFFSSQTLTTLGYGRIAPVGFTASSIAAVEAMLGLFGFAIATGLLYGRFSRPEARLMFSENALIAPYRGGKGLMFRLANKRRNQLIEIEIDVNIGMTDPETGSRTFVSLPLERKKINLFPSSWTVVHPIDESSPLYNKSVEDLRKANLEIYPMLKAFDETFSQTVYARTSYRAEEIIDGAKFIPMFHQDGTNTILDLSKLNAWEKVNLPS